MIGIFIWTMIFLFTGVFIGYVIGSYLEMQKNEKILKDKSRQTNADRIRSMSDEELAEFLTTYKNTFGEEYEGEASCAEWLQSEAE